MAGIEEKMTQRERQIKLSPASATTPNLSPTALAVFNTVIEAMECAEAIWGPEDNEYETLMQAIATECNQRIANFREGRQ